MSKWLIALGALAVVQPGGSSFDEAPVGCPDESPSSLTEKVPASVDALLADLSVWMSEAAVDRAIATSGLIGLPIVTNMIDCESRVHLQFVGDYSAGPVTFEYDANRKLLRWYRWKSPGVPRAQ